MSNKSIEDLIKDELKTIGPALNRIEDALKAELQSNDNPQTRQIVNGLAGVYIALGNMCSMFGENFKMIENKINKDKDN